jgi:hypothetical protein
LEINQGYKTMHGQPIIKRAINVMGTPLVSIFKVEVKKMGGAGQQTLPKLLYLSITPHPEDSNFSKG